jgi:Family of unknown function (DUF6152)
MRTDGIGCSAAGEISVISKSSMRGVLAVSAVCFATAGFAHHSYAMFDLDKEVVLDGTVREVQWTNPHVWIELAVKDKSGKETEWGIEAGSPRVLKRFNIERTTINAGDKVTLTINPLRSGQIGGSFVRVVLPKGQMYGLPVGQKIDFVKEGDDPAKGLPK